MTSRAGVPTKIGLFSTSSTMTRSPRCNAVPHAACSPWTASKNSRNGRSNPRCAVIRNTITLEQLDVAHLGAGDLDGRIQDVVQQQRKIACLQQARTHLLHPRDVLEALAQGLLSLLARCDVVETIDGSGDVAAFVLERPDIHDDGNPRAVWPLDEHLSVTRLSQRAGDHFGHGTLFVRHVRAVRTEQLERATEALVRISQRPVRSPTIPPRDD